MGPSHQVIQGHVRVHGHVAELESKDLPSGLRVREGHKDDPIEATRPHQGLEGGKKRQIQESGGNDFNPSWQIHLLWMFGGVTEMLSARHGSAL